jgi:alpha-beta hydrolase superfamily lysophospholipase
MRSHRLSFTVVLTATSRLLILRDHLLGRIPESTGPGRQGSTPEFTVSAHSIPSGNSLLDAVFVEPAAVPARASVVLCHGIGETIDTWFPVQKLLAKNGVASLLFDYSGYGRSTGTADWDQYEEDAVSAFRCMQRLTPTLPCSILGFSLGSGIAAAVIHRIPAHRLILCAAFTSFRDAARRVGIPKGLSPLVPPIWNAIESLPQCGLPVLVVHGDKDRLFPIGMARELVACCGANAQLIVAPNMSHNQPFRRLEISYWGPIVNFLVS